MEHCELPLDKVALLITQTGGGCRASNYIYLLRKALNKCGYGDIPVISASFIKSEQSGGFSLPLTMLLQALYGVLCGDLIMTLYNQCIPYEKQQGASQQAVEESILWAEKLFCKKLLRWKEVSELMVRIIKRFDRVERSEEEKIKVGVVGEIYVKYSPLGNNNLEVFCCRRAVRWSARVCSISCSTAPTTRNMTVSCTASAKPKRRSCAGSTAFCAVARAI